jgi:ABC-2 type transport system ATP-binding protein
MSLNAIEVENLTKSFGPFTAVSALSFSVRAGEIFGFLGANGAGKSTTIRMLCGLLQSTSGSAQVGGFDINTQTDDLRRNIGYMSQRFSLYDDLTVEQNIRFFGGIYGLRGDRLSDRMKWVVTMAGLEGREGTLTRALAGGFKQRLALGCAILHEPKIVFLDEPTGGVDPVARRNFWDLISTLSEQGVTVLVTTHFLDEAEYCNDIILIEAGRLIAAGSPVELKTEYIRLPILEVSQIDTVTAMKGLAAQSWVQETSVFGSSLHVMVRDEEEGRRELKKMLGQNARIDRIVPSLEDVFLYLLERERGKGN